jgi:hypothetical protein
MIVSGTGASKQGRGGSFSYYQTTKERNELENSS